MTHVHVLGAAGYAAGELIRLVLRHPELELGICESASHAGSDLEAAFPELRAGGRRFDGAGALAAAVDPDDVVVLAGDAELARATAPAMLAKGARVVDLSDAFRLATHAGDAVYGWTERYGAAIAKARLIANPGCYPTATLLALAPLAPFARGIVQLVVDAKSGVTGAGRKPRTELLFAEAEGDVRAYGLDGAPARGREIVQELAAARHRGAARRSRRHVVPIAPRNARATAYAIFRSRAEAYEMCGPRFATRATYASRPFVRVLAAGPSRRAWHGVTQQRTTPQIHVSVRRATSFASISGDRQPRQRRRGPSDAKSINLMFGYARGVRSR